MMAKDSETKTLIASDPRTKREKAKITRLFKNIGENHASLVTKLIDNAAFLAVYLEDLRADIRENGYYDVYVHGAGQSGRKRSVAAELYQVNVKIYATIIRQLTDLLPPGEEDDFGLMEFINSRDR